jgi:hypothetical protein
MKSSFLLSALLLGLLSPGALAQTGTLDQVSPFASEAPVDGSLYDFDATSLTWQCQVFAGIAGTLEGFEIEVTGNAGATVDVAVHLGSPWQGGAPAWSGTATKTNSSTEIIWVDVSSANISLQVGDDYSIEFAGGGTGMFGTGTHEFPRNTYYTPDLYLISYIYPPEFRIGFHTYMVGGMDLSITGGTCGSRMSFLASGANPNAPVAFIYAFGLGSYIVPNGPCAGTVLGLDATATLAQLITADGAGDAAVNQIFVPPFACGAVFLQALDASDCSLSNVILIQ